MLQWGDVNELREFFESKVKLLQLFSPNPSVQEEIFGCPREWIHHCHLKNLNKLSWHQILHPGSGSQVNSPSLLRVCAMLYGRGSTSHQQVIAVWCETEFHALRPSPLAPIVKVIRGDIGNGCLGWMKGAFMPKKRSKQWLNRIWTKESALPESICRRNLEKVAASVDFLSRSAWISSAINLLPVMISESWPTYCAFNLNIKTSEDASKQTYKAHCGRPTFNDRGVIKTRTTLEGRILPLICSSQIKIFGSHPKHTELSFWEVGRGLWNWAGHLPSWRNTIRRRSRGNEK